MKPQIITMFLLSHHLMNSAASLAGDVPDKLGQCSSTSGWNRRSVILGIVVVGFSVLLALCCIRGNNKQKNKVDDKTQEDQKQENKLDDMTQVVQDQEKKLDDMNTTQMKNKTELNDMKDQLQKQLDEVKKEKREKKLVEIETERKLTSEQQQKLLDDQKKWDEIEKTSESLIRMIDQMLESIESQVTK